MDYRKKLINFHEAATRRILTAAANSNGAEAFPKLRIGDVLHIEGSALSRDLYGYALRAHFDFVVADSQHVPLFAVEFDGPHHQRDQRARANDLKKNAICKELGFPLARICDEHIFRKARGVDYLSWLTELFFSHQALVEAQEAGTIPEDEPLDVMMFLTNPHLPGMFPLFLSAHSRRQLQRLHVAGVLSMPVPHNLSGYDSAGSSSCLALLPTSSGETLIASASLYIRGFGVAPTEVVDEIATIALAEKAESHAQTSTLGFQPEQTREIVIRFLREHRNMSFGGMMASDLGFDLGFSLVNGQYTWRVGRLGNAAEVVIVPE